MIWSPKIFFGRKWRLGDRIFPALHIHLKPTSMCGINVVGGVGGGGGGMPRSSTARTATTSATSGPTDHWSVARSATVDSLRPAGTLGVLSSLRVGELHRSPVVVGFSFSCHCAFLNSSDSLALPFCQRPPQRCTCRRAVTPIAVPCCYFFGWITSNKYKNWIAWLLSEFFDERTDEVIFPMSWWVGPS